MEDASRRQFLEAGLAVAATTAFPRALLSGNRRAEVVGIEPAITTTAETENLFNHPVVGFAMSDTLFNKPGTTNEPMTEAEIEYWLGKARGLGATAIRVDFDGNLFQSKDIIGDYDWSYSDRIMQAAKKFKLDVLATVTYAPEANQLKECQGKYTCAPANLQDFADFAGAVAQRYEVDGLRKFEIWNEPNIQVGGADPIRYARMFNLARQAIKNANKDAVVSLGALAGVASNGDRLGPADFVDEAIKAGAEGFDAVSFNAYSHPNLPDQPAYWNPFDQIEGPVPNPPKGIPKPRTILSVLKAYGMAHLPILITEFGASTAQGAYAFQSESVTQVLNHKFRVANVPGRYAYTEMDRVGSAGYDQYGLIELNGALKPAARAFSNFAQKFRGLW